MIDAPLKAVYQTLVNVDKRPEWLDGVATINREMTSERIGMRHNCVFHGLKLINTAVFSDFHEDHARYSEKVEVPEQDAAKVHYPARYRKRTESQSGFDYDSAGDSALSVPASVAANHGHTDHSQG